MRFCCVTKKKTKKKQKKTTTTEDHWSCFAHLSAEDMLTSAVIAEKKFKHSLCAGADNPLRGQKFYVNRKASSLW